MKKIRYTQVPLIKVAYTCRIIDQKARMHIHALSCKGRRVHWVLVHGIKSLVFGPMFLDHGISSEVLIQSIGSMVLICYGFGPWY